MIFVCISYDTRLDVLLLKFTISFNQMKGLRMATSAIALALCFLLSSVVHVSKFLRLWLFSGLCVLVLSLPYSHQGSVN